LVVDEVVQQAYSSVGCFLERSGLSCRPCVGVGGLAESLAAGEWVAAGADLDLEAGSSLADHGHPSCFVMPCGTRE
jgi:hypothetical protein